jgi:squalene-hopene/tetraprenyl-beta-curcumene cyclase
MAVAAREVENSKDDLDQGIAAALDWADARQDPRGFWVGMLESNACIEAEWILAFHVLGYEYPHIDALVRGILQRQRHDGSWESYFDAPSGDINATVETYAALRLSGLSADDEPVRRARDWILANGGLRKIRVFTRIWLALIGEWPWTSTPNLPPEVIRLPLWLPFNIYHFASWARATLVPLAVLSARRHVRKLPAHSRLDELFPDGRESFDYSLVRRGRWLSWNGFFWLADKLIHQLQSLKLTPGRSGAIHQCLQWIIRHQDADGAWGGIQPPWIYSLMALRAEGYSLSDPIIAKGLAALEGDWSYQRDGSRYIQASESPVWDTALMTMAMLDCDRDTAGSRSIQQAADWLLAHEVRVPGDWTVKSPGVEPGGWAFQRANANYPDIDDTALVVLILARLREQFSDPESIDGAIRRAVDWMFAMQSSNGGWAAFDKDNDAQILTRIPFCDFGEALDPASADVTAHVLEALAAIGADSSDPAAARGLAFLRREQEPSGSWFGRWGVNHIYGTAAVLPALRAIGEDMTAQYVRRAAEWLVAQQNDDGGWGESCASYMDPEQIGRGASTASQTAWAMIGLAATGASDDAEPIRRGTAFLLRSQQAGTWHESQYTGTGFPGYGVGARLALDDADLSYRLQQGKELQRGFMINYNLYRHYFPLAALGRVRRLSGG